jgi:hypothetical protein
MLVCNSVFPKDPADLPALHGPSRDGLLLWNALVDPYYGLFSPEASFVIFEQSSEEIRKQVGEFFQSASTSDTLLFYYSGHGQRYSSQLVLCGQDTQTKNLFGTGVTATLLRDMMTGSKAAQIVIILDCCHAGAFKGAASADDLAGIGRYIIAASSAQKEAGDAERFGLPSPFTATLIDGLKGGAGVAGEGRVNLDELFAYINENLPAKYARPHKNFHGSGVVTIANRPGNPDSAEASAYSTPETISPRAGGSAPSSAPNLAPYTRGGHGQNSNWFSALPKRTRFDLSYGDLAIWRFYLLSGIFAAIFSWLSLTYFNGPDYPSYLYDGSQGPSPTTTCFVAFGIAVLLIIASIVEGIAVWRISSREQSRRQIFEKLQSTNQRRIRACRNWIALFGAIFVIYEFFQDYTFPRFAILLVALAVPFVLTAANRFDYGDAAFLAGTLTIGFALFMPSRISGYNMLDQISGISILQFLLVLAMLSAWYFNASPAVFFALSLFNIIPVSLVLATAVEASDSIVGPYVSLCGAALAFLASLLGDGTKIESDSNAVPAMLVSSALNGLVAGLRSQRYGSPRKEPAARGAAADLQDRPQERTL